MNISHWMKEQQESLERLKRRKPGERFQKTYRDGKGAGKEAPWKKALWIALGVGLILVGALLSLPPGLPGFLLWIPGLVILLTRIRGVPPLLDQGELKIRRAWRDFSSRLQGKK
jgi:Flp pilus assembly protein TadB